MAKRERGKRNTNSCEGYFDEGSFNSEVLRKLLGLAVKYILPEEHWDYRSDIEVRSFRSVSFDVHPTLMHMIGSFQSRSAVQMKQANALNNCLKWIVGYDDGLSNPRCKLRTRKKRMTRVAKDFRRRLRRRNIYDRKSGQGITLFVVSVKRKFLGKGGGENVG
jgi:hypothetical protein